MAFLNELLAWEAFGKASGFAPTSTTMTEGDGDGKNKQGGRGRMRLIQRVVEQLVCNVLNVQMGRFGQLKSTTPRWPLEGATSNSRRVCEVASGPQDGTDYRNQNTRISQPLVPGYLAGPGHFSARGIPFTGSASEPNLNPWGIACLQNLSNLVMS